MDKIFSARIDDSIIRKIGDLSDKLHTSKKAIIEKAVQLLWKDIEEKQKQDIFAETCGIWQKIETPAETVKNIKDEFRKSFRKHQE
ncbi:MAG: hypothetical protein PWR01_4369 [Clostridiales bacterium]|jgi:hypothetical protein|nr:hypothetical protein [Clostridiales bacterium]MDN5283296.1 hypothetical protein [Candidatus Ozemobacter sp.]